jgi:hypothetical protein
MGVWRALNWLFTGQFCKAAYNRDGEGNILSFLSVSKTARHTPVVSGYSNFDRIETLLLRSPLAGAFTKSGDEAAAAASKSRRTALVPDAIPQE